ncbi:MAG: 4Fe-4S dicluster domain-containing protein [Planctomycetes bacterium]|nr:4Fe-4S dicluster domain-containing protein [Planctomycetota bacterium]
MMEESRRKFLKGAAVGAVASAVGCAAPKEGKVRYGMVIDLKKCVGCKACVAACKAENHTPPGVAYNVVMEWEEGEYPTVRRRFLSRPCMQCKFSSCVKVCPTGATYHREDGIVAINYDKCIGCRYCITACPYGARCFDYGYNYHDKKGLPGDKLQAAEPTQYEATPSPEWGQNRVRRRRTSPIGNVRKCSFCLHRVKKGLLPACAATCIGRAIHFGNLNDPNGELRQLIAKRGHMRLKEHLGNEPSVYYLE